MSQHDEHDDLSALDFSSYQSGSDDGHDDGDALDFSAAHDSSEESEADALDAYAPTEPEEADDELEAIAATTEPSDDDEDEEEGVQQFTVTNPPETVSVSALIDGRTQRVKLSPKATNLTEDELADEIVVLAELARQKGLAGQRTYVMDSAADNAGLQQLTDMGLDSTQLLRDFVDTGMRLPTEEQAETAQAEVFAVRYAADK
ncbi:ESX-1 secretion-associated protein EspH [Mycobacterium ahvazicum]|uniref:ESX-1 secretion-associated protein EspH n=1 Tax=Mycobacterium ahvazicum TaxID=1964395 RepID=A0A2K4YIR7_9MYCO|nr:DUF2694 domain-containing protein [Mycobacterium ahvazicum]SOX56686.1 ESX-1 secretion-associated protein EspH [Mycobacterium ahvazicum]